MSDGAIETQACSFQLDTRGFVRATMRQGAEMNLEDAREALLATAKLTGGRRMPVLVDSRGLKSQTKESRNEFVSEDAAKVSAAVALLVASPVSRMIGNFFLRRCEHRAPTQLFTEEAAAIRWLMQYAPE